MRDQCVNRRQVLNHVPGSAFRVVQNPEPGTRNSKPPLLGLSVRAEQEFGAPVRHALHCPAGLSQVSSSEFRVPNWPGIRKPKPETPNAEVVYERKKILAWSESMGTSVKPGSTYSNPVKPDQIRSNQIKPDQGGSRLIKVDQAITTGGGGMTGGLMSRPAPSPDGGYPSSVAATMKSRAEFSSEDNPSRHFCFSGGLW